MVMLAEKYDPRIVADKEKKRAAKEADKEAKEADVRKRADEEAGAKAWDEQMEKEALDKKSLSKAEKEKLKKAESKARNILRKLLRLTATKGMGSNGEYGILTDAEVEILCGNCELEDLNIMNNAMGGEPATKDEALFTAGGVEEVTIMLEKMKGSADHTAEDERMSKDAAKRVKEEASRSTPKKKGNNNVPTPDRAWADEDYAICRQALSRYPAGTPNRWVLVTNFVNDKITSTDFIVQDEVFRACFRAATGQK